MPKGYQQSWQEPEDAHTKHISTTQPVFPVLPNPWMMKEVLLCEEKCDFWMVEEFIAEITYRFKKKRFYLFLLLNISKSQLSHTLRTKGTLLWQDKICGFWNSGTKNLIFLSFTMFSQKLCPCGFCSSHLFSMKNPLLQNMKQPKSATLS